MEPTAVAARASLDSAREAFEAMTAAGGSYGAPGAVAASASSSTSAGGDASHATAAGRSLVAWRASEAVLRAVTGRTDLAGQALVGEARRSDRLTLGDAHVLVALHGWMERQQDPANGERAIVGAPTEAERSVAREALLALEHAVATVQRESRELSPAPGVGAASRAARSDASGSNFASPLHREDYMPPPTEAGASTAGSGRTLSHRYGAYAAGAVIVAVLIGGVFWFRGRSRDDAFREGAAAYAGGSREAARLAFSRAALETTDDPRPLIYLGRIAREDNDLALAQRFLERAIRLAPESALAQREMGSTLLARGQPDVARLFYARAIKSDTTDRLAQGFLACAMHRLGRTSEAATWANRAGAGEWSACLAAPPGVIPAVPGGPIPIGPPPPATSPGAR